MEVNPNHPVTKLTRDIWYKIAGVIMLKQGLKEVEITESDVELLGDNQQAIVADCRNGKFVVRMMPMDEAVELARSEGGLPH
jgi:hypothetical protein